MFKIVKAAPKIVKLTAGAKKNNRKEIKRIILRVFLYMFSLFFEVFGKFEKNEPLKPSVPLDN